MSSGQVSGRAALPQGPLDAEQTHAAQRTPGDYQPARPAPAPPVGP